MFESVFTKIAETFSDHRGQKSSWGRWAGSVIIATILFVWAFLCLKKIEWVDMGPYNSLAILGIFITLAYKSIQENKNPEVVLPPKPEEKIYLSEDSKAEIIQILELENVGEEEKDRIKFILSNNV